MDDQKKEAGLLGGSFSPPAISLPKGGGAIRGIGEKFAANPVTGTGSFSIPVPTSPGRLDFGPKLNLTYDSGSGNGPFGFGWSLSLPSITRKTEKTCMFEVQISDVGVKAALPLNKTVYVDFTPAKSGSFRILCGMGMQYGKLVVN